MTNILQLHTQNISDLMVELDRNNSPVVQALHNLAANGNVYPLNEKQLGPLRRKGTFLSRNEWGSPILTGNAPMATLPNTKQTRNMLYKDIGYGTSYHFSPTRGSPEKDGEAIVELLNNLDNPHYSKPGSILRLESQSFERLCQYKVDWPSDGILGVSDVAVAVSPADDAQDLEYSDNYMLTTLLSGSKVWLAFPPLPENLTSLQAEYRTIVEDDNYFAFNNLTKFRHGIAIIQRTGQTLVLPPFWIAMSLTTQTSASCVYHVATALVFAERINNIDDFLMTIQLWSKTDTFGQQRLVTFAAEMIEHLQAVLTDNFPHYSATKTITEVCRAYEMLRSGLRRVLDAIDDKPVVRGLENTYRAAWFKFLEEKRKKNPSCRLCNLRIQHMSARGTPTDRIRQHFVDVHCLRSDRSVQAIARK